MKRLAMGVLLATALGMAWGLHSSVYACDRSQKAEATARALRAPTVTVDVLVPFGQLRHIEFEHVTVVCEDDWGARPSGCTAARSGAIETAVRTARTAATLGRALVTTVSAVVGSLVDAAVSATSGLV